MARNVDQQVSANMETLARIIREVRLEYPRMELGQLHLLLIALARPGIPMQDLQGPTSLTKSAVSRNVRALSEKSYLSDEDGARNGLDLVTQVSDPLDGRSKLVAPTTRGRRLAERLSELLEKAE